MTIEISTGVLIAAGIAYVGPAIGFIIWVKTEVSLLKQAIANIKELKVSEDLTQKQNNKDIKDGITTLTEQLSRFQTETTRQLYDLNSKITRAETLAEVGNKAQK